MSLRINTNLASINSQRQLFGTNLATQRNLERLSSGYRINRAADDAAGLAISENLRAQIRGMKQANRNANDGISLAQVAEGGLNEISNMLIRMRELAIQSSSDTISDVERGFVDMEFQGLKKEIQRVAEVTEYNGQELLNGLGGAYEIQVGVHNDPFQDRITFDATNADVTLDALGLTSESLAGKEPSRNTLAVLDESLTKVNATRADLGAFQNRLVSTINNLNIAHENLSAANSRIKDADIAEETAELTRNNVMMQANMATLSQANNITNLALKLLG
ncbi:MAG: flagellin FliC [Bdellovibrionaceae bacterium]|nr:flagellin FliC [Pseudobdellovibrionaceae bacterium]